MNDTPSELKQLVRCVMRTFYGLLPRLIMDALMKHGSMQRDQLATLLKLDKNKIQAQLAMLSGEKFVKTRIKMETTAAEEASNGSKRPLSAREQAQRTSRHTFYFVNFRGFLNSVKYKLDHVRRRLEAQEREAMYNRSLFRCEQCKSKYSELDVIRLFNREKNAYFCFYCQAELKEEGEADDSLPSAIANTNGKAHETGSGPENGASTNSPAKLAEGAAKGATEKKSRVALFHEQARPIVALIRTCEQHDLTAVFAAAESSAMLDGTSSNSNSAANGGREIRLIAAPTGVKREVGANGKLIRPNLNLVIEIDGVTPSTASATPKVKETPLWLKTDASGFKVEPPTPLSPTANPVRTPHSSGATSPPPSYIDDERIKRLVFQREVMRQRHPDTASNSMVAAPVHVKKERVEEELDYASLRFDWLSRSVSVGGVLKPFNSLTKADVSRMSSAERAEYIRIGRLLYDLCD